MWSSCVRSRREDGLLNTWPDSTTATDSVTEEHVPEEAPGHISKC